MGTAPAAEHREATFSAIAEGNAYRGPRIWLWPNLLSLDAPIVAVLWQILFLRCFRSPVELLPVALLALTVWLIYAADRALDALAGDAHTARHRFYRKHGRMLAPLWIAGFAAAAWMAFTGLPAPLLRSGFILLGGVSVYFFAVHAAPGRFARIPRSGNVRWTKEAAVAVLFAMGSSLGAWQNIHNKADVAAIVLFSALCWINCVAIEHWERNACPENRSRSTSGQRRDDAAFPLGLFATGIAIAAIFVFIEQRPVLATAEMASALAFLWLDHVRPRLSTEALRVLADAALLSPILLLPIAGHV
ncbi:MAG: hypothetical protein ABL967_04940 [Bryobacteraceae bacterium]